MRNVLIGSFLGMCVFAANARAAAWLQYGYDFTSGDVTSQGNLVTDDSGNGLNSVTKVTTGTGAPHGGGNGGNYSADIPAAANRQFTSGIGSVDTSLGSHQTIANNVINNSQILSNGGLTFEAWIKPSAIVTGGELKEIISESGVINLALDAGGNNVFFRVSRPGTPAPGGNINSPNAPIVKDVWTHVAGVLDNVSPDAVNANRFNGTLNIYVNGELKGSTVASNLTSGTEYPLTRATAIGNHPTVVTQNFKGLIYEPRISLGALAPSQFTVVPEPAGLGLLAAGAAMMLRRRR